MKEQTCYFRDLSKTFFNLGRQMATFYFNLLIYIYICLKFSRVDIEMSGSSQIVNVKNNACLKRFLLKKTQLMGKWEGSLLKKSFCSSVPGL